MDVLFVARYYLCMNCDYTAAMGIALQFGLKNIASYSWYQNDFGF
jgi:hypothetical protein